MKIVKVLFIAALVLVIALRIAMGQYDERTKQGVLETVSRELPVGSSLPEFRSFMARHTTRIGFTDRFDTSFGGYLPQSKLDKCLFDRQVRINLKLDENQAFQKAEVNIFYTTL